MAWPNHQGHKILPWQREENIHISNNKSKCLQSTFPTQPMLFQFLHLHASSGSDASDPGRFRRRHIANCVAVARLWEQLLTNTTLQRFGNTPKISHQTAMKSPCVCYLHTLKKKTLIITKIITILNLAMACLKLARKSRGQKRLGQAQFGMGPFDWWSK